MRLSPIVTNRKKIPHHGFESHKTGASPAYMAERTHVGLTAHPGVTA
jgi:hypothetical protein